MSLATNKQALFDYEILEKLRAGLVLTGQEVKSIRGGHVSLKGAYVTFHGKNAFLTNAHVSAFKQAGPLPTYDPTHSRQLLLKRKEISYLKSKAAEQGLTIVPLSVYTERHLIKVEIAVARGRHQHDKRSLLKERDVKKEIERAKKFL